MAECEHPIESREYDPGNYVPPFGWELYPGWFCMDCSEELDPDDFGPDPDLARDEKKEAGL